MTKITKEYILNIHKTVEKRFNVESTLINNNLDSIVEKPDMKVFGKVIHDTVFLKAACVLEGIIRMHPFVDGNKRTALAAAIDYLTRNKYYVIFPLKVTRYTVDIARDKKIEVEQIASWIERHSTQDPQIAIKLTDEIIGEEHKELSLLLNSGKNEEAEKLISEWLAFDIYPSNKINAKKVIDFLTEMRINNSKYVQSKKQR